MAAAVSAATRPLPPGAVRETLGLLYGTFKLRIGSAIMLSALAGMAVAPGSAPAPGRVALLALAVLLSSASAGAFNQMMERDLDRRMARTRNRPFVTGRLHAGAGWFSIIVLMTLVPVLAVALIINGAAALFVFLGAFVYGIVYTLWLKRRSWLNIVVGGLAGSFAVLAGAAAVDPHIGVPALLLALVLFLWTPPHFWSLAIVYRDDYAGAGVPMLPVVHGNAIAARVILAHTLALFVLSLLPAWYGLGPIYLAGALLGGLYFVHRSVRLVIRPDAATARANFRASLLQLCVLLLAAILDTVTLG